MLRRGEPTSHDRTADTTAASSCESARLTARAPSAATSTARDSGGGSPTGGIPNRVDVQVEELAAKLHGGLGDLLSVAVRPDSDLDAKRRWVLTHVHPPHPHTRLKSVSLYQ